MSKTQPQNPPPNFPRKRQTWIPVIQDGRSRGCHQHRRRFQTALASHALPSVICSPTTPGGGEKGSNAWNCPSSTFFSVSHPSIPRCRGVGTSVEGERKKKKASCIAGLRVASQRSLNPVPFSCLSACLACTGQNLDEYRPSETSGSSSRATRHFRLFVHPSTRTNKPHESSTTPPLPSEITLSVGPIANLHTGVVNRIADNAQRI